MSSFTEQDVLAALGGTAGPRDPLTGRDFVASRAVRNLKIEGSRLSLTLELGYPARSLHARIAEAARACLAGLPGVADVAVTIETRVVAHTVQGNVALLPGARNIVAVSSGKGGVGKSTTAVNFALALAAEGGRVGILDADIYGPSQPQLLGLAGVQPETAEDGKTMYPLVGHGLQMNSIGALIGDTDTPMVWRGPLATQALRQLLTETRWDDLDYLVIDMPPGTGDIQITLAQSVPVTGALVVTTPQDLALLDASKGIRMFEKVGIPILGIVENMAVHVCSNCGHAEHIFGEGGGQKMCADYGVPFLGGLPLDMRIRQQADSGVPTVVAEPDGPIAAAYRDIARRVGAALAEKAKDLRHKLPAIVVKNA